MIIEVSEREPRSKCVNSSVTVPGGNGPKPLASRFEVPEHLVGRKVARNAAAVFGVPELRKGGSGDTKRNQMRNRR